MSVELLHPLNLLLGDIPFVSPLESLEFFSLEAIQNLIEQYGYWVLGIGILLENAGFPVPGETLTLVGGFLAGNGDLNYWGVLGSATVGATLGGNLGYWIGVYGGWPLLLRLGRVFRIDESKLLAAKEKYGQNAGKAVFLGRFITLLRVLAGPLAGVAEMPYPKFFIYNLAGSIAWASITISLAYVAGRTVSLEQLAMWATESGLVILVLVIAALGIYVGWELRRKNHLSLEIDE